MDGQQTYDLVVIGAGVLGLAHAWHAARAGLTVAVVERGAFADGASVRNFGMLAHVAQRPGWQLENAQRTGEHWHRIAAGAGISLRRAGCLFVARSPEELQVLREAVSQPGHDFELVGPDRLDRFVPGAGDGALLGGLWSPNAWKLDQRQAMARMADWLARAHDVRFFFDTPALGVGQGEVHIQSGRIRAGHVVICAGDEFRALFPEAFAATGITRCQLQMLRTVPQPGGWILKPFVLGGLSVTRYEVFRDCPSLPALRAFQDGHQARHRAHGIHVIACQEDDGSITIGDSHHYGDTPDPRRSDEVDQLILEELDAMIRLPDSRIAQRWIGRYAHLPAQDELVLSPAPDVTAVTVGNGQGMTHGLGLAERIIAERFGPLPTTAT